MIVAARDVLHVSLQEVVQRKTRDLVISQTMLADQNEKKKK